MRESFGFGICVRNDVDFLLTFKGKSFLSKHIILLYTRLYTRSLN